MLRPVSSLLHIFTAFFCFVFKIIYWSIVDLPMCWFLLYSKMIHIHIYIYIYIYTHFFHILVHYGLSQDIEYSSLCYTVRLCCLFILYITVCICNPSVPLHPSPFSLATTSLFSISLFTVSWFTPFQAFFPLNNLLENFDCSNSCLFSVLLFSLNVY